MKRSETDMTMVTYDFRINLSRGGNYGSLRPLDDHSRNH
jgi:hypothetical protein